MAPVNGHRLKGTFQATLVYVDEKFQRINSKVASNFFMCRNYCAAKGKQYFSNFTLYGMNKNTVSLREHIFLWFKIKKRTEVFEKA